MPFDQCVKRQPIQHRSTSYLYNRNRFSDSLDLDRRLIKSLDLIFEEANELLNKNSDLYRGVIKDSMHWVNPRRNKKATTYAYKI